MFSTAAKITFFNVTNKCQITNAITSLMVTVPENA